jgi:hypothetical protein
VSRRVGPLRLRRRRDGIPTPLSDPPLSGRGPGHPGARPAGGTGFGYELGNFAAVPHDVRLPADSLCVDAPQMTAADSSVQHADSTTGAQ